MLARCLICDRWGLPLAEARPEVARLWWRLNYPGEAHFTVPYADPACRPELLAFGNRISFSFDNGLPLWAGILSTPRSRDSSGISCTAFSGEALLDWRISAQALTLSELRPGAMAAQLLQAENAEHPTGVQVGSIAEDGDALTLILHYHDLLDRLRYVARIAGQDFQVRPGWSGQRLGFWLDWYAARGSDLSSSVGLVEGANVTEATLLESGMLANRVVVVGDGVGWGPDRIVGIAEDLASQAAFGVREWAELHTQILSADTAAAGAARILAGMAWPGVRITLRDVLDLAPGSFGAFDVGDTVTVQAFSDRAGLGFNQALRVVARTWYGDRDVCDVELGGAEWLQEASPLTDLGRASSLALDAGDAGASAAAWLLLRVGDTAGYVRVYATP